MWSIFGGCYKDDVEKENKEIYKINNSTISILGKIYKLNF